MALTTFSPKDRVPLPKKILHFAYGANMNPAQISECCSRPKVLAVARLEGHALAFAGRSAMWDGGMEAAIPAPGHDLWGVLYELNVADADSLDSRQGAHIDGTGPYFHFPVSVIDRDGTAWQAAIYKRDTLRDPQPPSREQLEFIIQGAVGHGLPEEYIEELRRIPSVPASYPVPRIPQGGMPSTSCTECDLPGE